MAAPRRAIVLITEGVAPHLLDRFGPDLLPAFHRMRTEGAAGPMTSEFVPYEPPGLFSAFTGHEVATHGCYSYWSAHSPDYQPQVLDSSTPLRPFLWHRPELADLGVAVVNVFGTHPVRPVNGYCVSYPMRRTLHACHPRTLPVHLARHEIHPVHDVSVWFAGQPRDQFTSLVLRADQERARTAVHLVDGGAGPAPDLTVLNLTAIDRLSHVYWQELEPGSPVAPEDLAVSRAYRLADSVLGELLDRVDERTSVLAFSEIGFGPLRAYRSLNEVFAEAGMMSVDADGRPDWSRCTAFEAVQGTHGVNVNLAGRYRDGGVRPADYESVRDAARAVLLDHVNPLTGRPMFADVLLREQVYDGPAADRAPDLVLVPDDWRYLPLGDPYWSAQVHRRLQSGWHRRESYWAGLGPAFTASAEAGRPVDVAPTVLAMLGRDPLPDLPGRHLGAGVAASTSVGTGSW